MTQGRESTVRARPAKLASSSHGQREAHHASEPAQKALQSLEQALQASEARFRNIIDKSADGVVVVHTDGVISFVNRAAQAMLDRKADQLVGQHFGVPTVPGETTEIDILSSSSQAARVAEMRVVETEWDATPCYLATLRDVTDRKGAEHTARFLAEASDELARSLDYRTTLAHVGRLAVSHLADWCLIDMLVEPGSIERSIVTRSSDVRHVNVTALEGRFGAPEDEAFGVGKALASGEAEVFPEVTPSVLATLAAPSQHVLIRRLGCRSLMVVPMLARGQTVGTITFVASRPGRPYGPNALSMAVELARRAAPALDNARLYEESQEAVRRRDEFLAMLSHELRNPLASIVNAAAVIRLLGAHDDSIDEARDVIERQGRHMTRLLDDLLDLSRITRGKISLCTQPLSFSSPLTNAIEACRPMLEAKGHELHISLPDEDMVMLADSTRLEQVFGNLLANAAKYTPPGGRICVTAARNEKHCVIRIEDNGLGIAPDSLARIFEPFFQSDRSLDRSGGGLGIGLTLVRRIVELHGGIVTVTSAGPGQGSQFEVRLPLAPQASRRRGKKSAKAASTGRRILIIEDNPDGRDILRSLLELSGHEVEVARDGREGLEAIRSGLPDVALVDIGLPLLNGHEIARRVRSSAEYDQVLLVALTGYGRPEDRKRALSVGFDAHLVKPVDFDELSLVLNHRPKRKLRADLSRRRPRR